MSTAVERGCGRRKKGGVYLEVPTGINGRPLEWYMCDPPFEPPLAWGLKAIGVSLVPDPDRSTHHILDWVGEDNYPDVAGFLEETRAHGLSRRLSKSIDFSKINERSLILLVHRRALIANRDQYCHPFCPKAALVSDDTGVHGGDTLKICRPGSPHWLGHLGENEQCSGIWYSDLDPMVGEHQGTVSRVLASGQVWQGYPRPPMDAPPIYTPAVFLVMPAKQFAVVNDPDDPEGIQELVEAVERSGRIVNIEEE